MRRYCELNNLEETQELARGMDFRDPRYRREVFLRFYAFHIKYKAHPGAVYYMFPHAFRTLGMTREQQLWWCFINGCSQHVVTTYLIWKEYPDLATTDLDSLELFFRSNYERFGWDTDRRYVKNKFRKCVESYLKALNGRTQEDYFWGLANTNDEFRNFRAVWGEVLNNFEFFGRLSTFSYLEYLRIADVPIDCDSLFLDDISGSKSHRNGLCKVLGRDDMDWTADNPVTYTPEILEWLAKEGSHLLQDAKSRVSDRDVSYFTLESTLCCYKGWHRENRRYPNVYNDMFYHRIKKMEEAWPDQTFELFWSARQEFLPDYLRLEKNPMDRGLVAEKQNHYRTTGEVIMMDREYDEFTTRDKPWNKNCILIIGGCGTGKTWVMKQIIKIGNGFRGYRAGKFKWLENALCSVIGDYDGTVFEGSDRLSMSVLTDLDKVMRHILKPGKVALFEGDRFTNQPFITKAMPLIIRIDGDGKAGREKRKTQQTDRHLKSISTRVKNINPDIIVENSQDCLDYIINEVLRWSTNK